MVLAGYSGVVQVTIDLPSDLAEQVGAERHRLAGLLARALRPKLAEVSPLRREVLSFLARGPRPAEIVAFHPSEAVTEHVADLLRRNKAGALTLAEEAEMDDIEEIDHLVSLIKAEARKHLRKIS